MHCILPMFVDVRIMVLSKQLNKIHIQFSMNSLMKYFMSTKWNKCTISIFSRVVISCKRKLEMFAESPTLDHAYSEILLMTLIII